jgi:diguanylate cyclase (GGDEF)-like protein
MKSFRTRVVWLLLTLVVVIQTITVLALVWQTNRRAAEQAGENLEVGARVLDALLQSRTARMREAVHVLVADYGFKDAATRNDPDTLVSALDNSAGRVNAQLAVLLDMKGSVIATTAPQLMPRSRVAFPDLTRAAVGTTGDVRYVSLGGTPFMLVSAPVRAPTPVAVAVLGFAVDASLSDELSSLLGYEVTFLVRDAGTIRVIDSRSERSHHELTTALLEAPSVPTGAGTLSVGGENYVTLQAPISGASQNFSVLLRKPLEAAVAPYQRLRALILLIAAVAILVAIPLARRLGAQISRPLESLANAARRIESGNYSQPVELDAPREFVAVAGTLDSMQRNIADREARIRHQASHDELTGLPNRLSATRRLEELLKMAGAGERRIALLALDIKDFDRIRSSFGYAVSDPVLREVARRMQSFARPEDYVAKAAVSEFIFIAPDFDADAAQLFAKQLLQSVRSGLIVDGVPINLDAHVGICVHPEHGRSAAELVRRADMALFDAHERVASIAIYEPAADEERRRQLALLGDLRRAINAGELTLHYQPKVDMRSHEVRSLEALVRWNHPQHGLIPPNEFVPIAERTGNIALLTGWVLKTALGHMRDWLSKGFTPDVAVNLSSADLADPELADMVLTQLRAFSVAPQRLVLEVTEGAVMRETAQAIATMERLRGHGVRFSVDDFGTGHSSLAQFKQLPVDELKIDKSFVLQLKPDSDDAFIVRSTIDLGHNLGVKVVAEGVETPESWRLLLDLGCDLAQGYFISPPVPVEDILNRVRKINESLHKDDTATQQVRALRANR